MTILDTNIIIDLFRADASADAAWSVQRFGEAVERGSGVACNHVVLAELSAKAVEPEAIIGRLHGLEITVIDLSVDASLRAGRAFAEYRRRGGPRTSILADFLVAGHAASLGAHFVTRDRRLASYFPDLALITPDIDHD